ncbi:protein FAR1-RELATED SEQUENCE 5-like [Lactuca sativa]|uniref:protein FAR1-RELATED SEQUENCE 5-like n=1 Tax=Lactuca sativa TaxID=4236 RepID=UPI000CD94734|nr:protein FAR1-RELATED SEQUENCE 5-like [Lactuca sativa]
MQVFPSYDEALAFYREYACNSGFEIRKATTKQSKKGDGYSRRRLTYHQKQLVNDVSDINIGPVRAFKILKQTQGRFVNVGVTEVECKNLKRDMITYIGESDADMVIEKLTKKKEYLHDFNFEYCVDSEENLCGLFWADEEAKRNYSVFGDVGFDATYRTNKYFMIFMPFTGIDNHKKCVTFAVGLLASESIESYKWLLMAFKITFGWEPTMLMTDQDPTIKQAIPAVFSPSCRHRLCMWHISQKFTDKLGSHMSKTGVLKCLNILIWNERISANEFDIEWQSIMDEYDLIDCHLSGLMRTTSRSEGENYFYGLMPNADLHLIEFVGHFETEMEAQRFVQLKNNHDSRYMNPEIITKLLIEEEASQTFTRTVFFEVQIEIMASMLTCYSIKVVEYDGITKFSIKDTDKDVKHFGDFEVSFMKSDYTVSCSCLRFKLTGCLCRHCFYVLRISVVEHFPKKYVSRRWTKDVVPRSASGYNTCQFPTNDANEDFKAMIRDIDFSVDYCVDRLVSNMEKLKLYRQKVKELTKDVEEGTRNARPMTNIAFIGSVLGVEKRDKVTVKIPEGIRNKGSAPIKNSMIGQKETAIVNAKKGSRKCGRCRKYVDHNARTCQQKANASTSK